MNGRLLKVIVVGLTLTVCIGPAPAQFDALRKFGRSTEDAAQKKKVACFKIEGEITETPLNMPPLFGAEPPQSLKSLLERLKEARRDSEVLAVVIDLQDAKLGFAQLEELRAAIRKFDTVGKEVYIHADSLSNHTYALAAGASHISLTPTGLLLLLGIYGETPYLRDTLDKIGLSPDFEQCGAFKSGAEPLMRTGPSEQSAEMMRWLFDGIYERFLELIAEGRGIPVEKVRKLIDDGPYTSEEALQAGLIDSVQHRQDFVAVLKKKYGESAEFVTDYGEDAESDIPQDMFSAFQALMKLLNPSPEVHTEPSVAIVYVDGTILPGEPDESPFGPQEGAFSTTIRKALDKAAADDSVKAVVMRVDSPGGSALASEIILDAATRVRAKNKPLIVSMGNVAGSGGYYVACSADAILASAGTITASIGVLGGKIVTTGMWDKLGVNWHPIQRGEMAGLFSTSTRFSDAERAKIRNLMTTVYDIFKAHVVKSRGDRLAKPIDELASGRVFTGAQALEFGLVDKIGGLEDAIRLAADKANLAEYEIRIIPEPQSIFEMFMGGRDEDDEFAHVSAGLPLRLRQLPLMQSLLPMIARVDPLRARAVVRMLQRLELISAEGAIMMMPEEILIR